MGRHMFAGDLSTVEASEFAQHSAGGSPPPSLVASRVDRLREQGFRLSPLPGLTGRADGLHAVRYWLGMIDAVVIRAFDCVSAARVIDHLVVPYWGDEQPPVVWSNVGDLGVIDELLALPRPPEIGQRRPTTHLRVID